MAQIEKQLARFALFGSAGSGMVAALVRLGNDLFVQDLHVIDHQQTQIANDVERQRLIGNVIAVNVEPEALALDAAAIAEADGKIK